MEARRELTASYLALSEQVLLGTLQVRSILSRDSLATNTYLYKHITPHLTLPLYILAE